MCLVSNVGARRLSWTKRLLRSSCPPFLTTPTVPAQIETFTAERQPHLEGIDGGIWAAAISAVHLSPRGPRGRAFVSSSEPGWFGNTVTGIRGLLGEGQCPAARSGSPGYWWRGGARTELSVTSTSSSSSGSCDSSLRSGILEREGWLPGNAAVLCVSCCSAAWRSLAAQKLPAAVSRG